MIAWSRRDVYNVRMDRDTETIIKLALFPAAWRTFSGIMSVVAFVLLCVGFLLYASMIALSDVLGWWLVPICVAGLALIAGIFQHRRRRRDLARISRPRIEPHLGY